MVPTVFGRIQTRLFLLAIVGGALTALITPILPAGGPMAQRYQTTFIVLAAVAVIGVAWEVIYHFIMQWRWEKDWPTVFGLLTLLPGLPGPVTTAVFVIHFLAVWMLVWMVGNGPMRVPFIRWRFRGGRLW